MVLSNIFHISTVAQTNCILYTELQKNDCAVKYEFCQTNLHTVNSNNQLRPKTQIPLAKFKRCAARSMHTLCLCNPCHSSLERSFISRSLAI